MKLRSTYLLPAFFLIAGVSTSLPAQQSGLEIGVSIQRQKKNQARPAQEETTYLNGYQSTLSGQIINYHSAHPDAEAALLVRANSEAHSISWQTDTVRVTPVDEKIRFIWLAGLERSGWGESKNGHTFDFLINGDRWFTFRNFKDSTASHWSLPGKDGSSLSFDARMTDKFGDQFGYMFLTLPKKDFSEGSPLILQVVGEESNSLEWFMTFQYRFKFTPEVRSEPALYKKTDRVRQVLRLSLDNLLEGTTIEINTPDGRLRKETLNVGANIFFLPIPAVDSVTPYSMLFQNDGRVVSRQRIEIKPVIRREIYLLPHSHNDIGYTDLQPNVERKQWLNIDEALRLIDATRSYPPEAQFKWNVEVLWPLESYLLNTSEESRQKVISEIRAGNIGVNALYGNELTGLATAVEMSHFMDYARKFSKEFSIPITTAVVSDIPGFTWGIVPAMVQSGVKFFASGPNSGDRIGYVLQQWGDKPFYWASQSGDEKILFWVAGAGYSTFHEGTLEKLGDEKIMKLMRRVDESGYPYEIVQLPYTLGDNGPPDSTLSDFVRRWNDKYASPRLIISTHVKMFAEFEKRYGDRLPEFKGDFTPYWEDGALSTAYETALNRQAADRLVEGEAIWSMTAPDDFPAEEYAVAWRNVVLYDEHTWGADVSVSEPDKAGVKAQWQIKRQFAIDADSLSRKLLERALGSPQEGMIVSKPIDVYNPTAWERSDLVTVGAEISRMGDIVVDESGVTVPSQRLSTGELAFLVERIAPMSAKRFTIRSGKAKRGNAVTLSAGVLENSNIRLSVNLQNGMIDGLRWKPKNIQFAQAWGGINQYLYVRGTNPDSAQSLTNVRIKVKEAGGLVCSILIEGDAPGCRHYETEVSLTGGADNVVITTTIDKRAVREKEAIHIAFPFSVPAGEVRYDVANAIVRPEADQLAGSCKNFFSVQSWIDVSNGGAGITLATPDAPLMEIGAITAEQGWKTKATSSGAIYSYVMNNYWHTNYKADQEGKVTFHYALQPHALFRPDEAVRFGRTCREPLIVGRADLGKPLAASLFDITPPAVLVASVKPIPEGQGWLLFVYNPTDGDQHTKIKWNQQQSVRMSTSDASGSMGSILQDGLVVKAHGSAYIRVDRK